MVRESFKEWLYKETASRFFLFHLKGSKKLFEEWHLPFIVQKFGIQKIVHVEDEETWKEQKDLLFVPSLFSEATLFLLWGISEKVAWEIKERLAIAPFFFIFFPSKIFEKRWKNVPQVIMEANTKEIQNFLSLEAKKLGVFLNASAEKKLLHFVLTYHLGEKDIFHFLSSCKRDREIIVEDVESFFAKDERFLLFRFLDAIAKREEAKSFFYLEMLQGIDFAPSWLIAQIARRFRILLQIYEGEGNVQDKWQEKELSPFEAEKIMTMKETYSLPEVYRAFTLLRIADRLIKTQNTDPKAVLARTIGEIVSRQGLCSDDEQGEI
ncbi:MAG: hypothetical protein ACUVQZ_01650 [Candidatus Caldatribacteriaceae bacterium]